jgi:L-gulonate 3-dehydrogenase
MQKIAVIGAGAIGRAWAIVFARAGHPVALFSRTETTLTSADGLISASLEALTEFALLDESPRSVKARIAPTTVLADAVEGAIHVQENAPENLAEKKALFHRLDELAAPEAIIASSTSTIPASAFASEVKGRPGAW